MTPAQIGMTAANQVMLMGVLRVLAENGHLADLNEWIEAARGEEEDILDWLECPEAHQEYLEAYANHLTFLEKLINDGT